MRIAKLSLTFFSLFAGAAQAADVVVSPRQVEDRKAVIATVEPIRQLVARTRLGGTITSLKAREGEILAAGAQIAFVEDPKLVLQRQALEQRMKSQEAQRDQARTDFDRIQDLQRRGVSTQVQLDQARTLLDVAERNLAAMEAERSIIVQQMSEGAVLAPGAGRVLSVPVSEGRVVLPGESVATLAEDQYILRLLLPERHAQIIRAGDRVEIAARGLAGDSAEQRRDGRIRLVYPEIQGGRVMADVEVSGLGDYFVGERTRVYVSTGKRAAILLPANAVFQRAGASFVRLKSGGEVVVQTGDVTNDGVEILSGLREGDVVVTP